MMYLDSNLFVYATLDTGTNGERARALLQRIAKGKETGCATSALTFDELLWKVMKFKGPEVAIKAARGIMDMPNLYVIPVDGTTIIESMKLMERYGLAPRDAIHAVCALDHGRGEIISEDRDFDGILGLTRRWLD